MKPVRAAAAGDLPTIQDIERSAGELFRDLGMPEIADDAPPAIAELETYVAAGRAWVLPDDDDRAVGYVLVDVVDGAAHVEQLSVHRGQHRRGHGRRLLEHVADWAETGAMPAVTLTTFRDVPWNAPYYERCGFRILDAGELSPGLAEVRARETAEGLDPDARVCMRLEIRT